MVKTNRLLGVLLRGMTYDGDAGASPLLVNGCQKVLTCLSSKVKQQQICRELFELFEGSAASEPAA